MKKILILAALATASATSFAQSNMGQPAFGQTGPSPDRLLYGELGYTEMELEDDRLPGYSSDNETLTAIIGYKFHPNFSGEVLLATGISEDDVGYRGANFNSELSSAYGVYVRPNMMATERLEVFGRLGFTSVDFNLRGIGAPPMDSESSFTYGAGANYYFTDNLYGQFAYTSFFDKDDMSVQGYTLGVGMKF